MRYFFIFILSILFLFSLGQDNLLFKTTEGKVNILSEAPLETIEAASGELKGFIDTEKRTFACELQVKSLKGFNSPLQQEHFYENYMETDKFPKASFSGKIIETIDLRKEGPQLVRAKGMLQLHGVGRERIIPVTLQVKDDALEATSEFTIPIADHDITVPRLVFQKIAEEITISIEASFFKTTGK